jgi:hypothetical protein
MDMGKSAYDETEKSYDIFEFQSSLGVLTRFTLRMGESKQMVAVALYGSLRSVFANASSYKHIKFEDTLW